MDPEARENALREPDQEERSVAAVAGRARVEMQYARLPRIGMKPERGQPAQRRAARKDAPAGADEVRASSLLEAIGRKEGCVTDDSSPMHVRSPPARATSPPSCAPMAARRLARTRHLHPAPGKGLRFWSTRPRSQVDALTRQHRCRGPVPETRPRHGETRATSTARLRPRPLTRSRRCPVARTIQRCVSGSRSVGRRDRPQGADWLAHSPRRALHAEESARPATMSRRSACSRPVSASTARSGARAEHEPVPGAHP